MTRPLGSTTKRGDALRSVYPNEHAVYFAPALGERIRQLREEQDISTATLAKAIGVGTRWLHRIEAGQQIPLLGRLYQISIALGCRTRDLIPEDVP